MVVNPGIGTTLVVILWTLSNSRTITYSMEELLKALFTATDAASIKLLTCACDWEEGFTNRKLRAEKPRGD